MSELRTIFENNFNLSEKIVNFRREIDNLYVPVKEFCNLSFNVRNEKFQNQISLYTTNLHRRFDDVIRTFIANALNDFLLNLKEFSKEIKSFTKKSNPMNSDSFQIMENHLHGLKDQLEGKVNKLIEISYEVKELEFSSEMNISFEKILKKLNKIAK